MKRLVLALTAALAFSAPALADPEDHFAKTGDVKIHYVTEGSGPLVVCYTAFPASGTRGRR